ncbi:MAG: putative outer rane transport/efflux protein [Bacteroidetes bacterium]|nr:putative outer rane transport/efflux protein [Bacteroidota bacterium]
MKTSIITGCLLMLFSASFAQKQWTLQECIDYATKHNIEIQQQELKRKNAEIGLNTAKNSRLPDLNANTNGTISLGMAAVQKKDENGNGYVSYESTTTTSSYLDISSSTPIFNGFRISNQIKGKELDLLAATQGLAKAKDNLSLNVASYFLDVLFKKEILKVYQEQEKLSEFQVQRTLELKEAGKVPESQLFDMKSQHATNQLNVVTADNNLKISLLNLTQQVNLQNPEGFDVIEPELGDIVAANAISIQPLQNIYNTAVATKPVVKESEYNLKSLEKSLKVAQAGYWPELSLNISAGSNYYSTYEQSFGSQLKNNWGEQITLSLSIPIFDRFATRNSVRTARNEILNSQLALESVKQALYKEIQQAYYNAVGAQAKYLSTQKAVAAAEIAFSYMKDKYAVGKATVFEYNESQTKLISSQSDLLQAKYDYIFRAKILDFYNGKEIVL